MGETQTWPVSNHTVVIWCRCEMGGANELCIFALVKVIKCDIWAWLLYLSFLWAAHQGGFDRASICLMQLLQLHCLSDPLSPLSFMLSILCWRLHSVLLPCQSCCSSVPAAAFFSPFPSNWFHVASYFSVQMNFGRWVNQWAQSLKFIVSFFSLFILAITVKNMIHYSLEINLKNVSGRPLTTRNGL